MFCDCARGAVPPVGECYGLTLSSTIVSRHNARSTWRAAITPRYPSGPRGICTVDRGWPGTAISPRTIEARTVCAGAIALVFFKSAVRCSLKRSSAERDQPAGEIGCVYRKLKHGRSGDEVRPGWRVN